MALAHDSAGTLYILVGAPYDDDAGGATGSAYLFRQGEFEMEFVEKLSAPDQAQGHVFGHYVALTAGDDGVMYGLVGALSSMLGRLRMVLLRVYDAKWGRNHKNSWRLMVPRTIGSGTRWGLLTVRELSAPSRGRQRGLQCTADCGAAYLFTDSGAGWTEQKLSAQDADEDDWFGHSVALIGIESGAVYTAIGAWRDDDLGENSGSVYTYQLGRGALGFRRKSWRLTGRNLTLWSQRCPRCIRQYRIGRIRTPFVDHDCAEQGAFVYTLIGGPLIKRLHHFLERGQLGRRVATDGAQVLAVPRSGDTWIVRSSPECTADGLCVCKRGLRGPTVARSSCLKRLRFIAVPSESISGSAP